MDLRPARCFGHILPEQADLLVTKTPDSPSDQGRIWIAKSV